MVQSVINYLLRPSPPTYYHHHHQQLSSSAAPEGMWRRWRARRMGRRVSADQTLMASSGVGEGRWKNSRGTTSTTMAKSCVCMHVRSQAPIESSPPLAFRLFISSPPPNVPIPPHHLCTVRSLGLIQPPQEGLTGRRLAHEVLLHLPMSPGERG